MRLAAFVVEAGHRLVDEADQGVPFRPERCRGKPGIVRREATVGSRRLEEVGGELHAFDCRFPSVRGRTLSVVALSSIHLKQLFIGKVGSLVRRPELEEVTVGIVEVVGGSVHPVEVGRTIDFHVVPRDVLDCQV